MLGRLPDGRYDVLGRLPDGRCVVEGRCVLGRWVLGRCAGVRVFVTRREGVVVDRCVDVCVRGAVLRLEGDCVRVGPELELLEGRVLVVRRPAFEDEAPPRDVLRAEVPLEPLELEDAAPGRLTCVGPALQAGTLKLNTASKEAKRMV